MGYDLHATRASHWTESAAHEITAADWRDVVLWDPELTWDKANGPLAVSWVDSEGNKRGWFDWFAGSICTTDPDHGTVGKLLALAKRMGARVQGDGDEFYEKIEDWEAVHRVGPGGVALDGDQPES